MKSDMEKVPEKFQKEIGVAVLSASDHSFDEIMDAWVYIKLAQQELRLQKLEGGTGKKKKTGVRSHTKK
jgi:hypothetical protein